MPPRQRDLYLENAQQQVSHTQAVAADKGLMGWLNGVVQHIGQNPISFMFNIGVSAVVRGAINANMLWAFGITGGLPALAVAAGAAMASAFIIGSVKNMFREEKLSTQEILAQSVGAGLFSGLIGGVLGQHLDVDPPVLPTEDLPSWPEPTSDHIYAKQYAWEITKVGPADIGFELAGDGIDGYIAITDYHEVPFGEKVNIQELLATDKDWFAMMDTPNESPYQMIHRAGLEQYVEAINLRAEDHGFPKPEMMALINSPITKMGADVTANIDLENNEDTTIRYEQYASSYTLTGEKQMTHSIMDHEFGHIYGIKENYIGTLFQTPHEVEHFCDAYSLLCNDNYEGQTKAMTRHIANAHSLGIPEDISSSHSHPAVFDRIKRFIETAAKDNDFIGEERQQFSDTLCDLQQKLDVQGVNCPFKLDEHWEQANAPANTVATETTSWRAKLFGSSASVQQSQQFVRS